MSSVAEKRTSKEYSCRQAVNPGQQFREFILQIPDKAIEDQGKQKHSEFKKPYLANSYEDMDYTWRPRTGFPDFPVPLPPGTPTGSIPTFSGAPVGDIPQPGDEPFAIPELPGGPRYRVPPKPGDEPFAIPELSGIPQYRIPPRPGDDPNYPAQNVPAAQAPAIGDAPNLEFPKSTYYPVPRARISQTPTTRRPGGLPNQLSGWAQRYHKACGKGMRLHVPASVGVEEDIKVTYYGGHDNSDAAHQNEYVLDMYSVERNGKTYYEQSTWEVGFGYSSFGITFDNDDSGEATLQIPDGDVTAVTVAIWPKDNWYFMPSKRKLPCIKKRIPVGWVENWGVNVCDYHLWSHKNHSAETTACPSIPVTHTTDRGVSTLTITAGSAVVTQSKTVTGYPSHHSELILADTGPNRPYLSTGTMKIKCTVDNGGPGAGVALLVTDSTGNPQYYSFDGYVNTGINLGAATGQEIVVDLFATAGFVKGYLQGVVFEVWCTNLPYENVSISLDYLKFY